jgi:phage terminase large subunit|tara:strand:- start:2845 stop:4050 length:1206 start_codon:yes stop_codon:yes gene_type:complete
MKKPVLNQKYNSLGNDTRYFVITGGRGSGKSFAITTFLAFLTFEQGHKILFTRYTMISASNSIIPEFLEKLQLYNIVEHFRITKDEILNTSTGSSIIFKGIRTSAGNQTAALKSINGITTWVLDEAEEMTKEEDFDKIDQSVRAKNKPNRVIMILNPATKEHWLYQRFFAAKAVNPGTNNWKDNVTYIHTTFKDNIDNLSDSFLLQLEDIRRRRPDRYNHQIMGGWLDKAEGVVFNNWKIGPFNNDADYIFGQDFGFSVDPTTLIKVAINRDRKLMWIKTMYAKPGLSTKEIGELNRRYAEDSIIVCDNAEPRLISELQEYCNLKPTIKRSGSILTGIALVQDYDLIIDADSVELIKELNNYVWHERNEKPVDKWNHQLDALRYSAQYFLANANKGVYVIR